MSYAYTAVVVAVQRAKTRRFRASLRFAARTYDLLYVPNMMWFPVSEGEPILLYLKYFEYRTPTCI